MNIITELVRERLTEEIPMPVRRDDVMEELPRPARFNRVHIIAGMRRSGKTFYVFQRMRDLLAAGVPRRRMFYFDFSDSRLPTGAGVIDAVLDEYWRQVPDARREGAYLFLDEIQDAEGWQGAARRLAEHELVTLVLTGSSSKLSSSQIATEFRGRSHTHEMLPCSFVESLRFHSDELPETLDVSGRPPVGSLMSSGVSASGTSLDDATPPPAAASLGHASHREPEAPSAHLLAGAVAATSARPQGARTFAPAERTALEAQFDAYLVRGGFPDVQRDSPATRIEVLQGYVRDVVARDVAESDERTSIPLAYQLALLILRSTSNEFSVNGAVSTLRAMGMRVGWEKASRLTELMREASLFFDVREWTRGPAGATTNPPKVYAVDPGLAYAVSRAAQEDIGNRLETAVYLELKRRMAGRRTDAISSYSEPEAPHRKVDFVVGESYAGEATPAEPYALYQVAATLSSSKTRAREISALDAAMARTGLVEGTVITLRKEESVATDHGTVRIVPAWKWFLG